jgi:uncharacterized membrane protein (DUF4010 family)
MAKIPASGGTPAVAAQAIAIGIVANCVLKTGLAVALGSPRFRRATSPLLAAMAIAITVAIFLAR